MKTKRKYLIITIVGIAVVAIAVVSYLLLTQNGAKLLSNKVIIHSTRVKLTPPPPMGDAPSRAPAYRSRSVLKSIPSLNPTSEVDKALQQLPKGNITYNAPKSMNLDDTATIELYLSLNKTVEQLKQRIKYAGAKVGERITVSDIMQAELSGTNFSVNPVTPKEQAVSSTGTTTWKWEIAPKKEGIHTLHLCLAVVLDVNGKSRSRSIGTYQEDIEVKVTAGQKAIDLFKNHWEWLFSVLLIPLGRWLWVRMRKKKTPKAPEE